MAEFPAQRVSVVRLAGELPLSLGRADGRDRCGAARQRGPVPVGGPRGGAAVGASLRRLGVGSPLVRPAEGVVPSFRRRILDALRVELDSGGRLCGRPDAGFPFVFGPSA